MKAFEEELDHDVEYVHAIKKEHARLHSDWRSLYTVREWDRGANATFKRFVDPDVGAKYFADSKETAKAEALDVARRYAGAAYIDPAYLSKMYCAYGAKFRNGCVVLSMFKAESNVKRFEKELGIPVNDCFSPTNYGPSQAVARQVSRKLSGVRYRSVRQPNGFCLAAYAPAADIESSRELGDL